MTSFFQNFPFGIKKVQCNEIFWQILLKIVRALTLTTFLEFFLKFGRENSLDTLVEYSSKIVELMPDFLDKVS